MQKRHCVPKSKKSWAKMPKTLSSLEVWQLKRDCSGPPGQIRTKQKAVASSDIFLFNKPMRFFVYNLCFFI